MGNRFLANREFLSGRQIMPFRGIAVSSPVENRFDPAQYEGAGVYSSDGSLRYSDGDRWRIPTEATAIARPSALVPVTAAHQAQLRLTQFFSPAGLTQTGIIFQVASAEDGFDNPLFQRIVNSTTASKYDIQFPEDGLVPGQVIFWRARYTGTDGQQSDFSLPFQQVYPELLIDPVPITREGATTGVLEISLFESAYGLNYAETQWEIYDASGTTLVFSTTDVGGNTLTLPATLSEGAAYTWRARYGGRTGASGAPTYTEWTQSRTFFNGARSMVLVYNPALATNRTINLPLGGTVDVVVDWGDGSTENFNSAGARSHTYATSFSGLATVTISGILTAYGNTSDQSGLIRVDAIGFQLGLVSLAGFLRGTGPNLVSVPGQIPPQVTSLNLLLAYGSGNPAGLETWDTSNVTNMQEAFRSNGTFNGDISGWDVSSVTNFYGTFQSCGSFNRDLGAWNPSSALNMSWMFYFASIFNSDLGAWDVSKVTSMERMFDSATAFNGDISTWDVGNVTNLSVMFQAASNFNADLSTWDVSSATNMSAMFSGAVSFNQDLGSWNVSNVTNMANMFAGSAITFSPAQWDVSGVTNMYAMFSGCVNFNGDISGWDVSSVINMARMFRSSAIFNRDISGWDTSSVTDMTLMFNSTSAFNQNIGAWNVGALSTALQVLTSASAFSDANYDALLVGWESQAVNPNVQLGVSAKYSSGAPAAARAALVADHSWTITDEGLAA